jgi:hypothetical protein
MTSWLSDLSCVICHAVTNASVTNDYRYKSMTSIVFVTSVTKQVVTHTLLIYKTFICHDLSPLKG